MNFTPDNLALILIFRYEDFYSGISKDGFSIHLKTGRPNQEERSSKRKNEDLDIVFTVENIEDLYELLSNHKVEIIQTLRKMDYGKEFYIADPDGYIIAFFEETTSTLNPQQQ